MPQESHLCFFPVAYHVLCGLKRLFRFIRVRGYGEDVERVDALFDKFQKYNTGVSNSTRDKQTQLEKFLELPTLRSAVNKAKEYAKEHNGFADVKDFREHFGELADTITDSGYELADAVNTINSSVGTFNFDYMRSRLKKAMQDSFKGITEELSSDRGISDDVKRTMQELSGDSFIEGFLDGFSEDQLRIAFGLMLREDTSNWQPDDYAVAIQEVQDKNAEIAAHSHQSYEQLAASASALTAAHQSLNQVLDKGGQSFGALSSGVQSAISGYDDIMREVETNGVDLSQTVFGNIDTANRQVIAWNSNTLEQFKSSVADWADSGDDLRGEVSSVLGSWGIFGEGDNQTKIAFSPILQTDHGAELLTAETVDRYMNGLIGQLGDGWTAEDLLKLDAAGIDVDGRHIQGLVADIGDTAEETAEKMRFVGRDGAVTQAYEELEKTAGRFEKDSSAIKDYAHLTDDAYNSIVQLIGGEEKLAGVVDHTNGNLVNDAKTLNRLIQDAVDNTWKEFNNSFDAEKLNYHNLIRELTELATGTEHFSDASYGMAESLLAQIDASRLQIQQFSRMKQEMLGVSDGFSAITKAQEIDSAFDYTDDLSSLISVFKSLYQQEAFGTETLWEAMRAIVPKDILDQFVDKGQQIAAGYSYVQNTLSRYITTDASGNVSVSANNTDNFIRDALNKPIDKDHPELGTVLTGSLASFDLNPQIQSVEQLASAMGVTTTVAFGLISAISKFSINGKEIFQDLSTETLEGDILSTDQKLLELDGTLIQLAKDGNRQQFGETLGEIDQLRQHQQELGKESRQNIQEYADANEKVAESLREYNEASEALNNPDVQEGSTRYQSLVDSVNQARDAYYDAVEQKEALEAPTDVVFSSAIESVGDEIGKVEGEIDRIAELTTEGTYKLKVEAELEGLTQEDLDSKLDELAALKDEQKEILLAAKIDPASLQEPGAEEEAPEIPVSVNTEQADAALAEWKAGVSGEPIKIPVELDTPRQSQIEGDIEDQSLDGTHTVNITTEVDSSALDAVIAEAEQGRTFMVDANTSGASAKVDQLIASINNRSATLTVNVQYNDPGYSSGGGSSDAGANHEPTTDLSQSASSGRSHAGGIPANMPHPSERSALVGELGPETVVDPEKGEYYTVGANGAEIVDLPKNVIVFDHQQTEALQKHGHISSRGKALAKGNAFSMGRPDIHIATQSPAMHKSSSTENDVSDMSAEDVEITGGVKSLRADSLNLFSVNENGEMVTNLDFRAQENIPGTHAWYAKHYDGFAVDVSSFNIRSGDGMSKTNWMLTSDFNERYGLTQPLGVTEQWKWHQWLVDMDEESKLDYLNWLKNIHGSNYFVRMQRDEKYKLTKEIHSLQKELMEDQRGVRENSVANAELVRGDLIRGYQLDMQTPEQSVLAERYRETLEEAQQQGVDLLLEKYGNVVVSGPHSIAWTDENIERFSDALSSWNRDADTLRGTMSDILLQMPVLDNVPFALTPVLETPSGTVLLDADTVMEYVYTLFHNAGKDWTPELLMRLDAQGIEKDGVLIHDLIAGIGEGAEEAGRSLEFFESHFDALHGLRELTGPMGLSEIYRNIFLANPENYDNLDRMTAYIVSYYNDLIALVKIQQSELASAFDQKGRRIYPDSSNEMQELLSKEYGYRDAMIEAVTAANEAVRKHRENLIELTEFQLNDVIENADRFGAPVELREKVAASESMHPGTTIFDRVKDNINLIQNQYRALQQEVHELADFYRDQGYSDTSDEIAELSRLWWEYEQKRIDATKDAWDKILDNAHNAVDDIQEVYDALHKAAEEYTKYGGYISVDAFQDIVKLGPQYLEYLIDENGLLKITDERIHSVIAARTEELALTQAIAYVQQLETAANENDAESLEKLLHATENASGATWDLVYAQLAGLKLGEAESQAALRKIDILRSLSDSAREGVAKTSQETSDTLKETKSAFQLVFLESQYVSGYAVRKSSKLC